ncbi:glycosyltransferase [Candidatus Woesearchaeota archaeon]|nr:glycosyltransferase [Candidatus Woesearchaeota archaeon]
MSISLCMIVRDEEKYLEQAIKSVQELVDEIIIVDAGSLDRTVAVARKYTPNVFSYKWDNDFSKARNFALSKATKEWILVLDADEVLSKEDHLVIKELTKSKGYDAYTFVQVSYTNDRKLLGFKLVNQKIPEAKEFMGFISCNIIRLFRNTKEIKFSSPVHESVDASIKDKKRIQQTAIVIHHYQFEKGERVHKAKQLQYLKIYEEKIDQFENKAKVYRDMGIIHYNFKEDYPKAIQYYKKSLLLNPNNIKTYLGLAIAYMKNKQIEEAAKTVEEAEKIDPYNQEIINLKNYIKRVKELLNSGAS